MARFSQVDQSKLPGFKYLGRGVDCRQSVEQWHGDLKSYSGLQIRALQAGQNVINVPREEVYKGDDSRAGHIRGSAVQ